MSTSVNIHDAKTHFSSYIARVEKGEEIILSKRNVPVAKIVPLKAIKGKRIVGQYAKKFTIPDSFFDPLPDEILKGFNSE